jgi:heptosyltransferase-3
MTYGNYPDLKKIQRVLVIKLRHHGDVLLTSPVFSQLKAALPHATIEAFLYADTLPMLEGHPAIDHYHLYDRQWKQRALPVRLFREGALLRALRKRRYDLVINLTEGDRGALIARLSGARCKVGLDPQKKGWQSRSYTHLVKRGAAPRHTVEKQLDALRRIGIFPEERDLFLHIPEKARERVRSLVGERPYLVIHPVSRWKFKCLSVQQMAHLLQLLHARGYSLVLSAGPDAEEKKMVEEILALAPKVPALNLAGKLSLKELAALIAGAEGLICIDSVPLHIASATKTPVVALFGPSSEVNWGPWMHPRAEVVSSPFSCRPCYQDGCGGSKRSECLLSIPPFQILSALDKVLAP